MSVHSGQFAAQTPDIFTSPSDRSRPTKPLPTDRVSPQNQFYILRAWASVSDEGTKAATVNEVSRKVGMVSSTVALTNPFFSSIGLLQRLAVGTYVPSKDVIRFFNTNSDEAARHLAPAFRDAWFGQLVIPNVKFAPVDEEVILSMLEGACGVAQEQRKALGFLLDFMEAVDLIERSNGKIKLSAAATPPQLVPTLLRDGSSYCISIRVDSKPLAESILDLFAKLAAMLTK
jgi:hypothetical protein